MAKNNLSRDQKRKAKLKKEEARSRSMTSLAYTGTRYQAKVFVPVVLRTEIGVFQADIISEQTLTDEDVEAALTSLILQMREGSLPPMELGDSLAVDQGDLNALIITMIRDNWNILAHEATLPKRDDLIGVLRTLLQSISTRRSMSMHSRSYLKFLEGFMRRQGISVGKVSRKTAPMIEQEASGLPAPTEPEV